jgi:hypothetical protein
MLHVIAVPNKLRGGVLDTFGPSRNFYAFAAFFRTIKPSDGDATPLSHVEFAGRVCHSVSFALRKNNALLLVMHNGRIAYSPMVLVLRWCVLFLSYSS